MFRTLPVAQMLSQSHGSNFIRFWLQEWLFVNKQPDEVITDASEALMSACVQAFAKCSNINVYLTACVEALLMEGRQPPLCFIRIDRSHFVRALLRNKHLRKEDPRVRQLILGALGYLITCESLADAEQVLYHVFTLTKNKFVNQNVKTSKKFLELLIGTHDIKQYGIEEGQETVNDLMGDRRDEFKSTEGGTYKGTLLFARINKLYESIQEQPASDLERFDNLYYSDHLHKYLMELCTRLPMWSNIMCAKFKSQNKTATSSASESHFKNIKRLMGSNTKRIDVYTSNYLKHFSGIMKMALAQQKTDQITKKTKALIQVPKLRSKRSISTGGLIEDIKSDTSFDSTPERSKSENNVNVEVKENWKNKLKKPTALRRSKASILAPHDINYEYHNVPLMSNYFESNYKARGKYIVVEKTCAFDSVLSVYSAAFFDSKSMRSIIDGATDENVFSKFIKNISQRERKPTREVKTKKNQVSDKENIPQREKSKRIKNKKHLDLDKQYYKDRTKILYKLYSEKGYKNSIVESENTLSICCETSFGHFLRKLLLLDGGKLSSVTEKYICVPCDRHETVH